jgi:hypothetical protein
MHFSLFSYEVMKSEGVQITLSEIYSVNAGLMKPVVEISTSKSTETYNVETESLSSKFLATLLPITVNIKMELIFTTLTFITVILTELVRGYPYTLQLNSRMVP